ncbi:unnamed protein product [Phaeothamnion confervicola]
MIWEDAGNETAETVVAVMLSHLKAIYAAFLAGHETALILEDDVQFDTKERTYNNGVGTLHDILANLPAAWRILQVGYVCSVDAKVKALRTAYDRGLTVRLRDPCGTDWVVAGAYAYVVSRAGMRALLRRFWPAGRTLASSPGRGNGGVDAAAAGPGAAGDSEGSRLEGVFDLRGVGNSIADYALYNMPHVYVLTLPAIFPPSSFSSEVGSPSEVLQRSRGLLSKHFGNQTAPAAQESTAGATAAARSIALSGSAFPQEVGAFFSRRISAGSGGRTLQRWTQFDMPTFLALAHGLGCSHAGDSTAAVAPASASDPCRPTLTNVWIYAHNCGLARNSGAVSEEDTNAVSKPAHIVYGDAAVRSVFHLTVDARQLPEIAGKDPTACMRATDMLVSRVLDDLTAETLPWCEKNHQKRSDAVAALFRPLLDELAEPWCRIFDEKP